MYNKKENCILNISLKLPLLSRYKKRQKKISKIYKYLLSNQLSNYLHTNLIFD